MRFVKIFTLLFTLSALSWGQNISSAPEGARVYFISPTNGSVVDSPVIVRFGLSNMGVAPAGVNREGTGHHHLLIDVNELPSLITSLPSSAQIRHFGQGQTEVQLQLNPGDHSLQLLMGNYLHVPHHKPVLSEKIIITVN
tara:strand:- start:75 stop:494 length:420 start_codon:yes stop_codon:yes gene_type:complete